MGKVINLADAQFFWVKSNGCFVTRVALNAMTGLGRKLEYRTFSKLPPSAAYYYDYDSKRNQFNSVRVK